MSRNESKNGRTQHRATKPSARSRAIAAGAALILAAGGPVVSGFASAAGSFWAFLLFGGMAMVLAAVTIQIVQAYRDDHLAKDLEDERSQLNRRIRDAVKPIPELIAQLPALSYPDRALRVQGIAQACATALYMLIAPHAENIRTAVFALEENPDRMTWLAHVGRGRTPCPFTPGTVRGDAAFEFITALQPAFYPDLTTQQPAGYDESPSDYRTFISIPLWTDESVYGMVTVDAPDPGALTVGDQYVAELIAELMAAAFEIANNGSLSTPLP